MQKEQTTSLREKKRRQTAVRIEDAATRLVDEKGFDEVTVEEICHAAGISRRTFFNYFDSKDEAVFGGALTRPDGVAEIRQRFLTEHTDNPIRLALELITELYAEHRSKPEIAARRKRLSCQPETAALAVSHHRMRSMDLVDTITERLRRFPDNRRRPDLPVRKEAFIISAFVREALWLHGLLDEEATEPAGDDAASDREHDFPATLLIRAANALAEYPKGLQW